jgi:acetylornithine deacetylase
MAEPTRADLPAGLPADVALLARLVATPSVSGAEGAAADLVMAEAAAAGFRPERAGHNVWFTWGERAPRLLLNSHIDTVPPCDGWSADPFVPRFDGTRLVGLGANDAKGPVAALLLAARALRQEGYVPPGTLIFALTAGEETGKDGLATILDHLGPLDAAVNGEPTSLLPCTAQRGILVLRCEARGVSGHVAHAGQPVAAGAAPPDNAIHQAARDIARLAGMHFPVHPLLGEPRLQVTTIEGGLSLNQVPDRCVFHVDLRTTPDLDHERTAAEIAAALESDVTIRSARYRPKETPASAPIVRAALEAAGVATPVGSRTASDWAFLGDVPTVKIGPGDTHRSHRPDEYLTVEELRRGARVYAALAKGYLSALSRR